jgi:hypothetical protein
MRSSVISSGITTSRYYSSNIVVYPRSTPCALSGPVVNEKLKKLSPSELLPWNPISVNHDFEEFPIFGVCALRRTPQKSAFSSLFCDLLNFM